MAPINKSLWIQQGTANAVLRLGYDALNYADVTVASTGAVSYGITGSVNTYTWGGQLVGPSGSAAAPSFSFVGNTSTGVYSDVAGTVKVAVGSQVGLKIEPAAVSGTDDGIQVGDVSMKLQSDIGRYYDQGLRVQATGTNQQAVLTVMPSGTSAASLLRLYNSSDPANTSAFGIEANGTTARIFITDFGTPTSLTNITYVAPAGGSHRWDVGTDDDAMFLTSNGVLTLGNEIRLPFGNATDPSYTFTSEGGTGMFGSAGVLGFSTAGVERLTISSTGVDVASGNLTVGAGIVIAGATAKISLDGPDGTVAAGSVGLAEKSGGLELSSRGNIKLFLDNDNDGAGHNFYIYSGTATSTTAVFKIDEAGAITAGTWDADVIASAYLDADTAHLSVAQTITGIKTFNTARTTIQQGTGSGDVDLFATGFHDGFAIGNNLRYSGGSSDPTVAANYTYIEAVGTNTAGSLLFMRGNGGEAGVSLEFYTAPDSTGVGGAVATLTKRFDVTAGTMIYGGLTVSFSGSIDAGTWNGDVIDSVYLDAQVAYKDVAETITGAWTFSNGTTAAIFSDIASQILMDGTATANALRRITWNDGGGNWNFRSGHLWDTVDARDEYIVTGDGAIHMEINTDGVGGVWKVKRGPTGTAAASVGWNAYIQLDDTGFAVSDTENGDDFRVTAAGVVASGTWNGDAIDSVYLDAQVAYKDVAETITGAWTFEDKVTIAFDGNEMLLLKDTGGTGATATPYIGFDDSAGTSQGLFGFTSPSTQHMYASTVTGEIRLVAKTGLRVYHDLTEVLKTTATGVTALLDLTVVGDIYGTGEFAINDVGPHVIGSSSPSAAFQWTQTGAFTAAASGTVAGAFVLRTDLILDAVHVNDSFLFAAGTNYGSSITTPASVTVAGAHTMLLYEPDITVGEFGTLNNAATLKIGSAPTAATNNYALWVSSGATKLGGTLDVTGKITASSGITLPVGQTLNTSADDSRDKLRVWNSNLYSIGMGNSYTFGGLNSYAMTFQMNNSTNRGWWWGHDGHTNGQGSMALTNTGLLTVAQGMRIGYGISDVTAPTAGAVDISGTLDVTGDATFNNTIRSNDGSHHNFVASNKTTDAASKAGSYAVAHYTNAEENVTLIRASAGATTNLVQIGGGSSLQNAATSVAVYAAATSTTTLGTAVATFSLTGVTVASGSLFVNTISERSAASGVTIDSVLLKDGGGTFSGLLNADGNIRVTGVAPTIDMWEDLDAPPDADEGYWRFVVSAGYMYLQTRTDVNGSGVDALKFARTSGTTVNQLEVGSRLYVNSQDSVILRGKNLDDSVSATWPAGRVPNDLQWDHRISTSGNYEVRSVSGGTVKNAMFIGHATGNVNLTESLFVDTISQYTTLTGVTVDGVLLKDSEIFSAAWKGSTIDEFYLDAIVARKNATQTFTGVNEFTQRTTFSGDDLTIESTGDIASDLGCNSYSATTFLSSNLYFNGTTGSDNPATSENWTYHAGAGASQTGGMLLLMRANGTGRSFTGYSAPTNGVNPDTVLGAITFTTLFNFNNNGLQVRGGDATTPGYSFTGDSNTGMYSFGSNDIGFSCGGGVDFRITNTQIYAYNPIRMVGNGAQATPRFTFNNDGDTGMYLDGIGVLGFSTAGVERLTISSTGITVVGTGTATDWVTTSDMRLKDKVANLDGFQSLYKLGKLDAFTYTMKDDESLRVHLGLSAQQVREQFPEVVTEDASGNLAIAYGKLVPALIEALNHQEARIQELEAHG